VKAEDIEATTADGVLEVTIPLPKDETKRVVEVKEKSNGSTSDGD
jgi:HSP20 family molecular chaperone IbpA